MPVVADARSQVRDATAELAGIGSRRFASEGGLASTFEFDKRVSMSGRERRYCSRGFGSGLVRA